MTVGKYVTSNACSSGKVELPNYIPRQLQMSPSRNFIYIYICVTFSSNLCYYQMIKLKCTLLICLVWVFCCLLFMRFWYGSLKTKFIFKTFGGLSISGS